MGKITVLGNCSRQTEEYDTVNFLVDFGGTVVLVDAGPGAVKQVYKAGYSVCDVDAVVLTHRHSDHVAGYPYFVSSIFAELLDSDRDHSFELVCTEDVRDGVEKFIGFSAPFVEYESIHVNFREVEEFDEVFEVDGVEFSVFGTDHAVPSFGLDFGDIVITGDTAPLELSRSCKMLFHEATTTKDEKDLMNSIGHSVAKDAGEKAEEIGAEELYLMHLNPEKRKEAGEMIQEAEKEFSGKVRVPEELSEIRF